MLLNNFNLEPKEASEYIKQKGLKLSFNYEEILHEAHHKAFTVAKITKLDLLSDVKESVNSAIKEGKTYEEFKKDVLPKLMKKGWWGDDVVVTDPKSGEEKTIKVNDRRLKNILFTNARVSYQVGKAKKIYENDNIKYIKYISVLDNATRDNHKKLHGKILAKDDPFWNTNYPPNGWNCRCRVQGLTEAMAMRRKKDIVTYSEVDNIADDDWAYDVKDQQFRLEQVYYQKAQKSDRKIFEECLKDINRIDKKTELIKFVDGVTNDLTYPVNRVVIGSISLKVYDFLVSKGITPKIPHIYLTKKSLTHMTRETKKGKGTALSFDEIKMFSDVLNNPDEIYFDETHNNILYIFDSIVDNRVNKMALEINYTDKKDDINVVVTSGKTVSGQLKNPNYIKLK
jgi:SPP1 gp7 family putative phage head morphogenesis protein